MKKVLFVAFVGLLMTSIAFASNEQKNHSKGKKNGQHEAVEASGTNVGVHVTFLPRDVEIIRGYYGTRFQGLPPGLQKKYRRTGQLPPGWRNKIEPFPIALEHQIAVVPPGYARGVIDGHAVIYNPRTQVIFDVAVLF
ncbi:MAG: hypothetical protein ACJ731_03165 [Vicinamibacterales bacterium]